MDRVTDNRSLGDLLTELSRETATLVHQEVTLARSELTRNIARVGRHTAMITLGAALTYAGLLVIAAGVVLALIRAGLNPWLAAIVAGAGILVLGYIIAQVGISALKRDKVTPEATVESIKENAEWAKNQLK